MPTPVLQQRDSADCATTCLAMVLGHYGFPNAQGPLRHLAGVTSRGTDLHTLSQVAERLGFQARGIRAIGRSIDALAVPAIAHIDSNHFLVVCGVCEDQVDVIDPAYGRDRLARAEFARRSTGIFLTLEARDPERGKQLVEGLLSDQKARRRALWHKVYLPPLRQVARILAVSVLLSLVVQLLALAFPVVTQQLIDTLAKPGLGSRVMLLGAVLAVCGGLQVTLSAARDWLLLRAQRRWEGELYEEAYRHILALPPRTFETYTKEDFLARLQSNQVVNQLFSAGFVQAVFDVLLLLILPAALFNYDPLVGAVGLVTATAGVTLTVRRGPAAGAARRRWDYETVRAASSALESIQGVVTLKHLGAETLRFEHWRDRFRAALRGMEDVLRRSASTEWVVAGISLLGQLSIFALAGHQLTQGRLTLGAFVAVIAIGTLIAVRIQVISRLLRGWSEMHVAFERLNDILLHSPEASAVEHHPLVRREHPVVTCVEVREASFRYSRAGAPALRELSLRLSGPGLVALVGRNGSGKSTLLKVLAGMYRDYEGRVTFDEREARECPPQEWRAAVGIVPQDVSLFEGTIRDNLLLANPLATEAALSRAVDLAGLVSRRDFGVLGLDSPVQAEGRNFSPGQRLKIAFARLFLQAPAIVLLDEASSALDPEAERLVFETVRASFPNHLIVFAAQRLNIVRQADRIIVLDEGRVVQDGTHDELVEVEGLYSHLCQAFQGNALNVNLSAIR